MVAEPRRTHKGTTVAQPSTRVFVVNNGATPVRCRGKLPLDPATFTWIAITGTFVRRCYIIIFMIDITIIVSVPDADKAVLLEEPKQVDRRISGVSSFLTGENSLPLFRCVIIFSLLIEITHNEDR